MDLSPWLEKKSNKLDSEDYMSNYYKLFYHLIWSTKNREPSINQNVEELLVSYIPIRIKYLGGVCYQVGMVNDHIHLVVTIPPNVSLSSFVQKIKGSSAHSINHSILNQYFKWQSGYGVVSFQENLLPYIKEYTVKQRQRHKKNNLVKKLENYEQESTISGSLRS